jgi:hypothetical protein
MDMLDHHFYRVSSNGLSTCSVKQPAGANGELIDYEYLTQIIH